MNESDHPQDPIQHQVKLVEQLRDSEREYGNELQILMEYYAEPLAASNGILTAEEHNTIFGEIRSIAEFSVKFLSVLDRIVSTWEEYIPGKYGDELLDFIPYLQMHENYVNFEHAATTLIAQLEITNEPFREFCESTTLRCNNRDLKTLLQLPLNRPKSFQGCFNSLLRYMDSIVSSSPRQSQISKENVGRFSDDMAKFRGLMAAAEDTVSTIEERMEENVAMDKLRTLESEIMDSIDLVSPSRRLIKRGKLKKIARKKMQSYEFFLLTDMVLYCRYAKQKTPKHGQMDGGYGETPQDESSQALKLKLHNKLPIDRAFYVQDRDDIIKFPNTAFAIHSSVKSFLVCTETENEKRQWIECLEHTLAKQLRNKRSIAGSSREMTVPLFLPDDYTEFCMECGTTFNDQMGIRKKHCNHCGRLTCSNCTKSRLPHLKKQELIVRVCSSCFAKNKTLFPEFPPLPPAVTPPPPESGSSSQYRSGPVTSSDGHLLRPSNDPGMVWESTTGYTSLENSEDGNTPPPSTSFPQHRVIPSDMGSDVLSPLIDSSGKEDEDEDDEDDEFSDKRMSEARRNLPSLIRRDTDQLDESVPDSFQDPSLMPAGGAFNEYEDEDAEDEADVGLGIVVTPNSRRSPQYDSTDEDAESGPDSRFRMVRHLSGHIDDQALRKLLESRTEDSDDDQVTPYVPDEYKDTDLSDLHVSRPRGFTSTLNAPDSDEEAQRLRKKLRKHRRESSAKIERFLQGRPSPQKLIGKGVLVSMPFLDHHVRMADKLEQKARLSEKLSRRLSQKFRPSMKELEERGILPLGGSVAEKKGRMRTLKKRASASLEAKLTFRPAAGDLLARGLVPRQFASNMLGVSAIGANVAQNMLYGDGGRSSLTLHPTTANESVENQIHIARSHRKRLLKSINEKRRGIGEQYESKFRDLQDEIAETKHKVSELIRSNDQLQQRVETQNRLFRQVETSNSSPTRLVDHLKQQVSMLELDRQQIMDSKLVFLECSAKQFNILRSGIRAYKAFSQPRDVE